MWFSARLTAIHPVLCCMLCAGPAQAIETVTVSIEKTDGGEWQAEDIEATLSLDADDRIGVSARIGLLSLPAPVGQIRDIVVRCPALVLGADEYRCDRAETRIGQSLLDDNAVFNADLRFDPATRRLSMVSADVPVTGHRITIDGAWQASGWKARMSVDDVDAAVLYPKLQQLSELLPDATIEAGRLKLEANAAARSGAAPVAEIRIGISELGVSNESGTIAADALSATVDLHIDTAPGESRFGYQFSLDAGAGEAYFEPAYFNLSSTPLTVGGQGVIDTGNKRLSITNLDYRHSATVRATASAELEWQQSVSVDRAVLDISDAQFPSTYKTYVQGFLVGTPLSKLQTSGRGQARFEFLDGSLQAADIGFEAINADDSDGRIAVYDASGDVHWSRDATGRERPSIIRWGGGFMSAIGYGAATMRLAIGGDDVELLGGLRVPVLDGALVVDTFNARGLRADRPSVDLDARLEPVGLRRLTVALGLPGFPGTVSGELPMLTLRDGVITLGGSLSAKIFDGTATISGLRIEQPFSRNRRGAADIRMDNLDLALLTDVVPLGRIQGRMDGRVNNLLMVSDKPVAFDARFFTPPNDRSRRRISRRAVSNLSEIAGAGTALLSGGFLKFFEEFRYSSLGIGCQLADDVCAMSGIEPAEDGYYLVKGAGLPRIDVIGHSQTVDWSRLVAQIEKALESSDAKAR